MYNFGWSWYPDRGPSGPLRAADNRALVSSPCSGIGTPNRAPCSGIGTPNRAEGDLPNIGLLGPRLVSDISRLVSKVWFLPKRADLSLALASLERGTPKVEPAAGLILYSGP